MTPRQNFKGLSSTVPSYSTGRITYTNVLYRYM